MCEITYIPLEGRIHENEAPIPYEELPDLYTIENKVVTGVGPHYDAEEGDGFTIFGPGHKKCKAKKTLIKNCIIDFTDVPEYKQDEAICGVHGAYVILKNVVIVGAIKACLCGNGEYPIVDAMHGRWVMRNVSFLRCGRRCPEAQDGVKVSANHILIEDWGDRFDERSFGMWAHSGASICASNVIFYQRKVLDPNFDEDFFSHIGQAFNDGCWNPLDYLTPGRLRGASMTDGGKIDIVGAYKNHASIRAQGNVSKSNCILRGLNTLYDMTESFLKYPRFYSHVRARCKGSVLLDGLK